MNGPHSIISHMILLNNIVMWYGVHPAFNLAWPDLAVFGERPVLHDQWRPYQPAFDASAARSRQKFGHSKPATELSSPLSSSRRIFLWLACSQVTDTISKMVHATTAQKQHQKVLTCQQPTRFNSWVKFSLVESFNTDRVNIGFIEKILLLFNTIIIRRLYQ